jgi:molybdopterin-containing oxidoreductase family iron-sulfur binding subunit
MDEAWKKSAADPRFRILNEAKPSVPRVPDWVHDDAMLRRLGPEFVEGADLTPDEPTRRHFLQIMGASVALAGASGCINQPQEEIVPYVRPPEQIIPGKPLYYATAMTLAGASMGLLVETHMGRPVKVEGNPQHPAVPPMRIYANEATHESMRVGATDAFAQATVLSLYDSDRSQTVLKQGQINTWDACYTELRAQLEKLTPSGGQGLRLLTEAVASPTLLHQIQQLLKVYPNARWHQYEPINDDNALAGARMAFDADLVVNDIGRPSVVLSLDADCLGDGPMKLQNADALRGPDADLKCRIYMVETSRTITGAVAEHRLPTSPQGVLEFALAVARALGFEAPEIGNVDTSQIPQAFLEAVVVDLSGARGDSFVFAGRSQPPLVHALANWLNVTLGNVDLGTFVAPASRELRPEIHSESIGELSRAMQSGEATAVVILGGNPAFDAPADLEFADRVKKVPFSLRLSQYVDETSAVCSWHVPETHLFEAWSDTRATDGLASIVQPLIAPLYDGKSAHEILAAMLGSPTASGYDLVRGYWKDWGETFFGEEFDNRWLVDLHDGYVNGSAADSPVPTLRPNLTELISEQLTALAESVKAPALHLVFRPDPSVWDGRFANNAWLQELPRPLTKLTWDNAALVSPQTADEHRIKSGDVVEIEANGQKIEIAAMVVPGHPRETITLDLGYGRERAGRVGNGVGTNVYPLRTSDAMWFADVTSIRKTGRTYVLATTQHHFHMEGRDLVRAGTLAEYLEAPDHPPFMEVHGHGGHSEHQGTLYPVPKYEGNKWGMVINQSACIGCNACVIACQSENNIPVVGKDQVWRGREMHWLRIDNYFEGDGSNLTVYNQPVLCQHCEYAPCEPVCPVAATTHSDEGLNEMTYNRCVGTRYCSNNCPYKVRRFNFYDYNAELRENATMQLRPNPDVTVRSRGVMEKCTYCVQRINAGRIAADIEGREIRDGEVITACQAACPTQAIVFGNLNDPESEVARQAGSSLNYSLLGELNTRPRTTYLAVVRNPNPAIKSS